MITVVLVDDHPVVRSGLRAVLAAEPTIQVVGEAASGEDAIALVHEIRPDVVLCDVNLGGGIDGIQTTQALRELEVAPAVIIFSALDSDALAHDAIDAGASGYLLKEVPPDDLVQSITAAAAGGALLGASVARLVLSGVRNPRPRLTSRETEVVVLLARGLANKEIAQALFVSEATVKSHLENIFAKLKVGSRSRAIHRARELGLM